MVGTKAGTKSIDGKTYYYHAPAQTITDAKRIAERLRNKGYKARILRNYRRWKLSVYSNPKTPPGLSWIYLKDIRHKTTQK